MARARSRGHTLIELLAVLAVTAVLLALATAGYRGQLLRAHRLEAARALVTLAAAQERHHLLHGRYAATLGAEPDAAVLVMPARSDGGRYLLGIAAGDAAGYALWARPRPGGPQQDDRQCALWTLDDAGRRAAFDAAGRAAPRCW